jgi:RNA polymerase sigma factor (sigma-70 family)
MKRVLSELEAFAEVYQRLLRADLDEAMDVAGLPDRYIAILRKKYWENETLEQIGNEQSVSRDRIAQILAKCRRRLRSGKPLQILEGWLED